MEFFTQEINRKLQKEKEKLSDFTKNGVSLRVISTADASSDGEDLLRAKLLFQKMLPKMPREYILKQVFDIKHCTLSINCEGKLIGAVCYRPAFQRHLIEIVFFAIDSSYHIHGYGTFLFNCLKEVCKAQYCQFKKIGEEYKTKNVSYDSLDVFDLTLKEESEIYSRRESLYLLTYADNSAIGFFKKQGFSLRPRSTEWVGYIKDYDGGTLMEGKIHKEIQYLKTGVLIKKIVDHIFEKMKDVNDYHIVQGKENCGEVRKLLAEYADRNILQERNPREFLNDFLEFLLYKMQSNPSAWPFLEPVNTKDVPDYLTVISRPMDLSLIRKKYIERQYLSLEHFESDVYLMVNNCFAYNGRDTQYFKCAEIMKGCYEGIKLQYSKILDKWGLLKQGVSESDRSTRELESDRKTRVLESDRSTRDLENENERFDKKAKLDSESTASSESSYNNEYI